MSVSARVSPSFSMAPRSVSARSIEAGCAQRGVADSGTPVTEVPQDAMRAYSVKIPPKSRKPLNSIGLPEGSRRKAVRCSPGSPSKRMSAGNLERHAQ